MTKLAAILFLILTGCGKAAGPGSDSASAQASAVGSKCQTVAAGTATTLVFYGNDEDDQSVSFRNESMSIVQGASGNYFSGTQYWRTTSNGSTVTLYFDGNAGYAVLSLSAADAQLVAPSGTRQICDMAFSEHLFPNQLTGSGFTGTLAGGSGIYIYYDNGYPVGYSSSTKSGMSF